MLDLAFSGMYVRLNKEIWFDFSIKWSFEFHYSTFIVDCPRIPFQNTTDFTDVIHVQTA